MDSNHDRVTDFEIGTDVVGLVAKHYSDSGLRLETLTKADMVTGFSVTIGRWAENNSLTARFDEAIAQAEFDALVAEAGSMKELLLDVV